MGYSSPRGLKESDTTERLHFLEPYLGCNITLLTVQMYQLSTLRILLVGTMPTPVFLPGESQGWRSLVGYSPQGRTTYSTGNCAQYSVTTSLGKEFEKEQSSFKLRTSIQDIEQPGLKSGVQN